MAGFDIKALMLLIIDDTRPRLQRPVFNRFLRSQKSLRLANVRAQISGRLGIPHKTRLRVTRGQYYYLRNTPYFSLCVEFVRSPS
jgi:hypothetical protein